jgi:acylphosphatase
MTHAITLVFVGRFQPDSFAEFVQHRARRLALSAGLDHVGRERIEVSVAGEPDLVDAFEAACSLGPLDCLVIEAFRRTRA